MPKISALPPNNAPDGDDEVPGVDDSTSQTIKWTLTTIKEWLQSLVGWISTAMIADSAITAIKTNFAGNFSTSEVNTGFKWLDGKDIYKKTINLGSGPNNTTKSVSAGITTIDTSVHYHGTSAGRDFPVSSSGSTALIETIRLVAGDFIWRSTYDATANQGYVTIYYTKV